MGATPTSWFGPGIQEPPSGQLTSGRCSPPHPAGGGPGGDHAFFHGRQVALLQHPGRRGRPSCERLFWKWKEIYFQREGAEQVSGCVQPSPHLRAASSGYTHSGSAEPGVKASGCFGSECDIAALRAAGPSLGKVLGLSHDPAAEDARQAPGNLLLSRWSALSVLTVTYF